MAKNPKTKPAGIFDREIDGVVGRFATTDSYGVQYLLCSLKLPRAIDYMDIAAEAFPFSSIDFVEMVQRDVDYARVNNIVSEYLERGKGRVLFFPPLIVAVVAMEKGRPKDRYKSVDIEYNQELQELNYTFDYDKFQLRLNVADQPTGYYMPYEGQHLPIYHYAATVAWTSNQVKLVVIDGQHRFEALRSLHIRNPELGSPLEVPICLVYSPDAIEGEGSEHILKDLREMFIRINTTAKQVSGHFIELLRDESLSSITVRLLADLWKASDVSACKSKLQLLEWNERSDSKASTVQRGYTITTISIIADVLRAHLYSPASRKNGVPQELLRLSLVQPELESNPEAPRFHQIDDNNFASTQEDILKEKISEFIVPGLDVLLTQPVLYQKIWEKLQEAVSEISRKADERITGYRVFKEDILGQFRRWDRHKDADPPKDAQDEFDTIIKQKDIPKVVTYNVFQQAYIRLWLEFSQKMASAVELNPVECAEIMVKVFDAFVFPNCEKLFQRDQLYSNRVTFTNLRPNVSGWGKTAWTNLCKAALLNPKSIEVLKAELEKRHELNGEKKEKALEVVSEIGEAGMKNYLEELRDRVRKDVNLNWRVKDYDQGLKSQLESFLADGKEKEFNAQIDQLVRESFGEAEQQLRGVLKVKS